VAGDGRAGSNRDGAGRQSTSAVEHDSGVRPDGAALVPGDANGEIDGGLLGLDACEIAAWRDRRVICGHRAAIRDDRRRLIPLHSIETRFS